jgi:predicted dehydrogenase
VTRVGIVGMGQAGGITLDALQYIDQATPAAAVDPDRSVSELCLRHGVPLYRSLDDTPLTGLDAAVVATPTPSHVGVCRALLERAAPTLRVLCEKPLATDAGDVRSLFMLAARRGVRLQVLYHYAYSPEVVWAWERWRGIREAHGPVISFESRFDDPKPNLGRAERVLASSWADSGINAMSVLARFVSLERVVSGDPVGRCGRRVKLAFRCGDTVGTGSISTTWVAPGLVKTTRLTLADGTVMAFNHPAQAATLGKTRKETRPLPPASVALARYRAMLAAYLSDDPSVLREDVTLRLHALLAEGAAWRRTRW